VRVVRLSADEALNGDDGSGAPLTLIDAGGNLGFAGGNNLGLRYALRDPALAYFWCLNNDTVVERDAIRALVVRMDATHRVGMCGTVVRYYHRPGTVQALNGSRFKMLSGQSMGIGRNQPAARAMDPRRVARETDFVLGASLAVSRAFLETVGFMEESYFLYFEEMDWSVRNRGPFRDRFRSWSGCIPQGRRLDRVVGEAGRALGNVRVLSYAFAYKVLPPQLPAAAAIAVCVRVRPDRPAPVAAPAAKGMGDDARDARHGPRLSGRGEGDDEEALRTAGCRRAAGAGRLRRQGW
jgi:hypothetical protein